MTDSSTDRANSRSRTFRVIYPDGYTLHGVQFASGRCVLDDDVSGLVEAAMQLGDLKLVNALARIEWDDETSADRLGEHIATYVADQFAANDRAELDRPKVERGGFLNDRDWALELIRKAAHSFSASADERGEQ